MTGIVTKSTGSWYNVKVDDKVIKCRIAGKMKLDDRKLTNPIAVGDEVSIELENEHQGIIHKVSPRRNYIVRQSPRKRHQVHFLASNIDQVVLIVTIIDPNLKLGFIDRFLLMCEPYNIPATIVFNKADINGTKEIELLDYCKNLYERIGYHVLVTSAVTGQGLVEMRELLTDKITLISGQSGVGKSTLVNLIEPGLELLTGEISDFSGKGQHTTTFAQMFELSFGGSIIDTPGIKTLAFSHFEVEEVAHNWREFFTISSKCKFNDCTHRNEPHCVIKKAIEEGEISESRYQNYLNILEEIEDQNYWERHTDV